MLQCPIDQTSRWLKVLIRLRQKKELLFGDSLDVRGDEVSDESLLNLEVLFLAQGTEKVPKKNFIARNRQIHGDRILVGLENTHPLVRRIEIPVQVSNRISRKSTKNQSGALVSPPWIRHKVASKFLEAVS